MAIDVVWDSDEKTVVRMDFYAWDWTDFHAALETYRALTKNGNQTVGIIVNMQNANALPLQGALANLQHAMQIVQHKVVYVAAKPIGRAIFEVLASVHPSYRHRIIFVDTLDEARAVLAKIAQQGDSHG